MADETLTPRVRAAIRAATALVPLAALVVYAVNGVTPARAAVLPSVLGEIGVWWLTLLVAMARSPGGMLRLSDPFVPPLGVFVYFLIHPACLWMHGRDFVLEGSATVVLTTENVSFIQWLHALFMASFTAAWAWIAPRWVGPRDEGVPRAPLPRGGWLLAIGLGSTVLTLVERLAATGSLRPTATYGDAWFEAQDALTVSRNLGGADQFVMQVFSKVYYLPVMAFGVGLGVTLARFIRQRRFWAVAGTFATVPLLMYLSPGGRSFVALPFMIGVLLADALEGPLPWRWVLVPLPPAFLFFNFYSVFRGYQNEELATATARALDEYGAMQAREQTEASVMLVKEAYAVMWTDATRTEKGFEYFSEAVLSLLPVQVVPEKVSWVTTTTLLSRALLGHMADRGAGVAGATVADGYITWGVPGVAVVGFVIGAVPALMLRLLLDGARQGEVVLWRVALAVTFTAQCFVLLRGDLAILLLQALYYVFLPALFVRYVLQPRRSSPWQAPVRFRWS